MSGSATSLNKKAIKAALDRDWESAVETNLLILELEPEDINAKTRLGKAYLELGEFPKAKKLFKEVLNKDPINKVATKNYELAKNKKQAADEVIDQKKLLKEPGTTTEIVMEITASHITSNNFKPHEELSFKTSKKTVTVYKRHSKSSEGMIHIGNLSEDMAKRLKKAKEADAEISMYYTKGNGKLVTLELNSSVPVFKSKKQTIKPYLKISNATSEDSPLKLDEEDME